MLAIEGYSSPASAMDDESANPPTVTSSLRPSDTPMLRSLETLEVYPSLLYVNEKFTPFYDRNSTTPEIYYRPTSPDIFSDFLHKLNVSKELFDNPLNRDSLAAGAEQDHPLVAMYRGCFERAMEEIRETRLISESNIYSIFGFFAALKERNGEDVDVWDCIFSDLPIPYPLTLTPSGSIGLIYALDWYGAIQKLYEQQCRLARLMGYPRKEFRLHTGTTLAGLRETMMQYNNPAAAPSAPLTSLYPFFQDHMKCLRNIDNLIRDILSSDEPLREYITEVVEEFEARCGVSVGDISALLSLYCLEESESCSQKKVNAFLRKLVESEEVEDYIYSSSSGKFSIKDREYFEWAKERIQKNKLIPEQEKFYSYVKVDAIWNEFSAEAKSSVDTTDISARETFLKNFEGIQAFKKAGDKIKALFEHLQSFSKSKGEQPKPQCLSKEEEAAAWRKTVMELADLLIKEEGMAKKKKGKRAETAKSKKTASSDDDEAFIEREIHNPSTGISLRVVSRPEKFFSEGHGPFGPIRGAASPAASYTSQPNQRKAERQVQRTERALVGHTYHQMLVRKIFFVEKKQNQETADYHKDIALKTKSSPHALPIDRSYFHQQGQPKYAVIQKNLKAHGIGFYPHPRVNKDLVYWKTIGRFHSFWIDRPHGAQIEKGKAAGWWLRMQEKFNACGLLVDSKSEK